MSTVRARLGAAVLALVLATLGLSSAFTATSVTRSVGLGPEPAVTPAAVAAAGDDVEAEARALALTARAARAARASASAAAVAASAADPAGEPATATKKTTTKTTKKTAKKAAKSSSPARSAKKATGAKKTRSEAAVAVPAAGRAQAVISFALAQVGKPYRFGAAGPGAYDCSGLVLAAYARVGISLPHKANSIAGRGRAVARASWQPGDVLAWPRSGGGHVAIYLGGGKMVHASRAGKPIAVVSVYGSPIGRRLL